MATENKSKYAKTSVPDEQIPKTDNFEDIAYGQYKVPATDVMTTIPEQGKAEVIPTENNAPTNGNYGNWGTQEVGEWTRNVPREQTAQIAEGLRPQSPLNTEESTAYSPEQTRRIAESLRPTSPQDTGEFVPSGVKNPVSARIPYVDIQTPKFGEPVVDRKGRFVMPYKNPTSYEEIMENWRAKDEYDKQKWNQSEKWRTISEAIIGAGEIAARALSGASGENQMGKLMLQQNAQGLEQLKYLRAQNKDRFGTELSLLQQKETNDLAKRRLSMQEANQRENLAYKYKVLQQKIDAAEAANDKRTADIHKTEMEALLIEAKAANQGEYMKSLIALNEAKRQQALSTANKNNTTVANGKTKPYVAGQKTYDIPKNLNLGDVYRALQGKLGSISGLTDKKIDKYHDDSYNGVGSMVNKIAQRYPKETDEVIKALGGVETSPSSSTGTSSSSNSTSSSSSSTTIGSTGSSSSASTNRTGNVRTSTTQRRHLKNPYGTTK